MTRVALDSNLLVYAELEPESGKGRRAAEVIARFAPNGVIPAQVLGEFLRVVQRKAPDALPEAIRQADLYRATFLTPATSGEIVAEAAELALARHLQLWDAVICVAASRSGAGVLLSEDLQDGGMVGGLRVVNPFNPDNAARLSALGDDASQ
ncbi:MAG: PIN domain-containing protein [Caulobacter sp.]